MHQQAPCTYLSLGIYFGHNDAAREDVGHFFSKLSGEKMQKPFQREGGKTADTLEATAVMEKHLNQALLDLHALGSACADSQLSDFRESRLGGEQVKLIKKMATT
ncbi:hypothetical protein J1605_020907 [Eschrichtius robustus]|uniref:Ferritin light chain n=1 Tax=Eschrichtius robustus TaxID=9764 RepID=A0AB34HJD3_ESCRO|nr:hypothetical protein J1605_020907 [Eschrichtius robustus]